MKSSSFYKELCKKSIDSANRLPLNVGIMNSRKSLEKNKFCQKDFVAAPHVCFS